MTNLLVIGKGGREHAIAWKLSKSPKVNKVFVIPGNSAIDNHIIESVSIDSMNHKDVIDFAKSNNVEFVIIGPEVELASGLVDSLEASGVKAFGPNKYCAQVESSKDFSKKKMIKFGIPTADYQTFDNAKEAIEYLENKSFPIVLKADGLAAGKGVTIPQSFEEAKEIILDIFNNSRYGASGSKVVIEEFLVGEEFSLLAFVNNRTISYMQIAQDHKRAHDGDKGENTGGMGVYTPVKHISHDETRQGEVIIKQMVNGLADEGTPFKGILYAGLMTTSQGVKTIEFNARFGDPETEVILPAMKNDLYEVVRDILDEKQVNLEWSENAFVGVVLASKGYPGSYASNKSIDTSKLSKGDVIFHMGTKLVNGELVSNGGRVILALGEGKTIAEAKASAYATIAKIETKDFFYRSDIGFRSKE